MEKSSKIFIAGHRGLAGSAIHRELVRQGYQTFCWERVENWILRALVTLRSFSSGSGRNT